MTLLGKVVEKILGHKRFGQDLLTTEDCSTEEARERILCVLFVTRDDEVQKAILPAIEQTLLRFRSGELGSGLQKLACSVLDGLVKAGVLESPGSEVPPAAPFLFESRPSPEVCDASLIASGKSPGAVSSCAAAAKELSEAKIADNALVSHLSFAALPEDVRNHCRLIVESVVLEGEHKKLGGVSIVGRIVSQLEVALGLVSCASEVASGDFASGADAAVREAMGSRFDAVAEGDRNDYEMLLKLDNLLLMYGAGMLLLSDTTLEMRKNSCYGVVGQNGAGKTTHMKEIVSGNIVGMPKHLK